MNPEERELLKKTVALEEENNDMLRSMQRSMRIARLMSILYWIFIIGSLFGAYYFIQPYVEQLMGVYGGAKSSIDSSVGTLNSAIDKIKNLTQ